MGTPLAELVRPKSLHELIGQRHLVDADTGAISNFLRLGYLPLMLLFGPPGVGKTSIARILCSETGHQFVELSATNSTVKDLRHVVETTKGRVVVFIDEIHRFSTTQQDFLLPFIEAGHFVFIGATTADPTSRIRRAILLRCQLFELKPLLEEELRQVVTRAVAVDNLRRASHLLKKLTYSDEAIGVVVAHANGDTRTAINVVELVSSHHTDATHGLETTGDAMELETTRLAEIVRLIVKVHSGLRQAKNAPLIADMLTSILQAGPATRPPRRPRPPSKPVRVNRSDISLDVTITLPPLTDSEAESDYETMAPAEDLVDHHIDNSDVSDAEPTLPFPSEGPPYTSRLSPSKFYTVRAIHLALVLLKTETPHYLMKQLIFFTTMYVDSDSLELRRVVGHLNAIQNTALDPSRVVAACIERLCRLPKKHPSLEHELVELLEFFRGRAPPEPDADIALLEVIHDPELAESLLADLPAEPVASSPPPTMVPATSLGPDFSIGGALADVVQTQS